MTSKQLSDRIGNIDDRLVQQTEQGPNNGGQSQIQKKETVIMRQKKGFKSLVAVAAVIALMVCSFCVGAVAFAKEIVVEVPVEQETIEIEEIGLTLICQIAGKANTHLNRTTTLRSIIFITPPFERQRAETAKIF